MTSRSMTSRLVGAVALVVAIAVPAMADTPKDRANRISQDIMSPFCPGVTLHDCPSDAAIDLRVKIESWARDGMSDSAIYDKLESEYDSLRAVPGGGLGVLAWVLPALAVLGGGIVAVRASKRWSERASATEPDELAPEDRERIESELEILRRGEAT